MNDLEQIIKLRKELSQAVRMHNHHRRKSSAVKIARNRMKQGLDYWKDRALKAEAALRAALGG
jgi:hypothetical protein